MSYSPLATLDDYYIKKINQMNKVQQCKLVFIIISIEFVGKEEFESPKVPPHVRKR
jgi:hypothetical protein